MIGDSVRKLTMHSDGGSKTKLTNPPKKLMNDNLVSSRTRAIVEPINTVTNDNNSAYLLREVVVVLSDKEGNSFTFRRAKMSISGSKYIGIQQDMFTITIYNIDLPSLAIAINKGYTIIQARLDDKPVFIGSIRNINTGRENIVSDVVELVCLNKVTTLLSDMVNPITVDSSINIWNVLKSIEPNLSSTFPEGLKSMKFDKEYTLSGTKRNVIENIIAIYNDNLARFSIKDLPWIDYEYDQEGILDIFSPGTILEILSMEPRTGLIGTPRIGESGLEFDSIYKYKLVPGRVVKLDNAYFSTLGGDTAFIYTWDPQGLYVITETKIQLSTYPNKYTISCKARPLSKYNNFVTSRRA